MNPVQYVINRISNTIPRKILDEAFQPDRHYVTLDERIREEVIVGRVLPDCNLFAGKTAKISLQSNWKEYTTVPPMIGLISAGNYTVYRIPPEVRDNRNIVSVQSMDYPIAFFAGDMLTQNAMGYNGRTSGDLACMALSGLTGRGASVRPTPILRESNMIYVHPPQSSHIDWLLTCRLEYDDQFLNMENNSVMPLAQLMECAVKAYIYNRLALEIDSMRMEGGYDFSKFKDIVESYADQNDKYDELLLAFRGSATLDIERMGRLMSLAFRKY